MTILKDSDSSLVALSLSKGLCHGCDVPHPGPSMRRDDRNQRSWGQGRIRHDRRAPRLVALVAFFALATAVPASAVEESSTRNETFTFGPGVSDPVVRVCNVEGDVTATGYDGSEVRLVVRETYRGDSAADLARAKERLPVRIERSESSVTIGVGHPCDCRRGDCCWGCDDDHDGRRRYGAHHDFELRVPRGVRVELKTVNDGAVTLRDHRGDFELGNVNGPVAALGVVGSGTASTVNGGVEVRFDENPTEDSSFRSVNGELDVTFRPGLAATFTFETLNGEVYTDLPLDDETLSRASHDPERGRYVLRKSYRTTSAGAGGPEISFKTVNGDVFLRDGSR